MSPESRARRAKLLLMAGAALVAMGIMLAYSVTNAPVGAQPSEAAAVSFNIREVTSSTWRNEVELSTRPVLVIFYNNHSPDYMRMERDLEQLASEYRGRAVFARVNADLNRDLASRYGASRVPVLFIFKRGQAVSRVDGYQSASQLRSFCRGI